MRNKTSLNARKALDDLKLEIANEFDAKITDEERTDGTMVSNLVNRAKSKIEEKEK